MKTLVVCSLCVIFVPSSVSAQPAGDAMAKHEKVLQDQLKAMADLTNLLKPIKTDDDADKAKDKIVAVAKQFKAIRDASTKLGPPDADTAKALQKKFKDQLDKARKDLLVEIYRLRALSAGKIVLNALSGAK